MTEIISKWEELVSNLTVWKRGGQVAPHKPLLTLLLLARAQAGASNQMRYAEVEEPLRKLLRDFGPVRKAYHPEFPFWHLQSDGFWHVHEREELLVDGKRRLGSNSPTVMALRDSDASGEVPEFLWRQLGREPGLIVRLARRIVEQFWPESLHESLLQSIGLDLATEQIVRKKRDPRFRERVIRAYERRCAVCGFDARIGDALLGIEAAHIKWHQYAGPDTVANGLALCSLHHSAFDRGAFTLSDDLHIQVSQDLTGHDMVRRMITDLHGNPLTPPQSADLLPETGFVNWHRKNVFRAPGRS
mgnify:CR=1 FL=1